MVISVTLTISNQMHRLIPRPKMKKKWPWHLHQFIAFLHSHLYSSLCQLKKMLSRTSYWKESKFRCGWFKTCFMRTNKIKRDIVIISKKKKKKSFYFNERLPQEGDPITIWFFKIIIIINSTGKPYTVARATRKCWDLESHSSVNIVFFLSTFPSKLL